MKVKAYLQVVNPEQNHVGYFAHSLEALLRGELTLDFNDRMDTFIARDGKDFIIRHIVHQKDNSVLIFYEEKTGAVTL